MSTRFGIGALLVVVSLMLVTSIAACRQSAGSNENPSGWRDFVLAPWESSGPIGSIEEMERIAGFAFVFPSYLPEGMDGKLMVDGSEGGSGTENGVVRKWGPQEEVGIPRGESDSPNITINEMAEPFPGGSPDWTNETEHVTIAATDVGCSAYPSQSNDPLNPVLRCDWLVGDKGFRVYFQWAVKQAIPGYVTQDMRQEALKVVESMIVAPEHPYTLEAGAMPSASTAPATDTPVAEATAGVQLPPTAPATVAPTPVTPGPLGCGDCKVRQRDQLPVSAQDIQMDSQGKYFIPDRGDGCQYAETYSGSAYLGRQEVMLWATGCEQGWTFLPATGEIIPTIP